MNIQQKDIVCHKSIVYIFIIISRNIGWFLLNFFTDVCIVLDRFSFSQSYAVSSVLCFFSSIFFCPLCSCTMHCTSFRQNIEKAITQKHLLIFLATLFNNYSKLWIGHTEQQYAARLFILVCCRCFLRWHFDWLHHYFHLGIFSSIQWSLENDSSKHSI